MKKEFDMEKAIQELFATPECQESIDRGIDARFTALMPSFFKPTPEELEQHRRETKERFSPKELIYAYSVEYTNKLLDMESEFYHTEMLKSLYDGLEEFGFSPERIQELKDRHPK
jgi:hypothetical protein